jgi:hypothetical protein
MYEGFYYIKQLETCKTHHLEFIVNESQLISAFFGTKFCNIQVRSYVRAYAIFGAS